MFSIFKKQYHVTGNEDTSAIDSAGATSKMTRFPTLRISKDGDEAEIFHLPTNQWCGVSMSYALENGTSWPSDLLAMPKLQTFLQNLKTEEDRVSIQKMPAKKQKIAA